MQKAKVIAKPPMPPADKAAVGSSIEFGWRGNGEGKQTHKKRTDMSKKPENSEHIFHITIDLRDAEKRPYMCRSFQIETGKPARGPAFVEWLTDVARDAVRDLDRSHMRVKRVIKLLSEGKHPNQIRKILARGDGGTRTEEEKVLHATEELMREGEIPFAMICRAAEALSGLQDIDEHNVVSLLRNSVRRFRMLEASGGNFNMEEKGMELADFRLRVWMGVGCCEDSTPNSLQVMGHRKLLREEQAFLDEVRRGIDKLRNEDKIPLNEICNALEQLGDGKNIVADEAELLRRIVLGELKRQNRKKD